MNEDIPLTKNRKFVESIANAARVMFPAMPGGCRAAREFESEPVTRNRSSFARRFDIEAGEKLIGFRYQLEWFLPSWAVRETGGPRGEQKQTKMSELFDGSNEGYIEMADGTRVAVEITLVEPVTATMGGVPDSDGYYLRGYISGISEEEDMQKRVREAAESLRMLEAVSAEFYEIDWKFEKDDVIVYDENGDNLSVVLGHENPDAPVHRGRYKLRNLITLNRVLLPHERVHETMRLATTEELRAYAVKQGR